MSKEFMRISYNGAIIDVYGDTVWVAYETEDDIVEHQYDLKQFLVPVEEGTRIRIEIVMSERILPPLSKDDDDIDLRIRRKNVIHGPHTF